MRNWYRPQTWTERFKMLFYLPLSDTSIRYFPPDFMLRDPVLSLVERTRRTGDEVTLVLIRIAEFHHIAESCPKAWTDRLRRRLRLAPAAEGGAVTEGQKQMRGWKTHGQ